MPPPVHRLPVHRLPVDHLLETLPAGSPLRDAILAASVIGPSGGEFVINSPDPVEETGVASATLADGNVIVIWNDLQGGFAAGQIHGQILDPQGSKIGSELVLTSGGSGVHTVDFEVAPLETGGFVVVWTTNTTEPGGSGQAIMAQIFQADGTAVTGEFQVNTQEIGDQHWPDVAMLAGGGFVVTWTDQYGDWFSAGDIWGWGIRAQIFDSNGNTVGTEIEVNTTTAEFQYYPTVAGLQSGGFVISWSDTSPASPQTNVRAQVFSNTGQMLAGELTFNTDPSVTQQHSDVAALQDGGFVVVWREQDTDTDIYSIGGQQFDGAMNAVGSAFVVDQSSVELDLRPDVTPLAQGGFAVVWERGSPGDEDVFVRAYRDWDDPWTGILSVNQDTTGRQLDAGITPLDNGFLVTWTDVQGFTLVGEIEGRAYDLFLA